MKLRKVSSHDRDIQRKYRVHTNCEVSYWHEEFDCGGIVSVLSYRKKKGLDKKNFGVSIQDYKVSNYVHVSGHRGYVGSG